MTDFIEILLAFNHEWSRSMGSLRTEGSVSIGGVHAAVAMNGARGGGGAPRALIGRVREAMAAVRQVMQPDRPLHCFTGPQSSQHLCDREDVL